MELNWVGFVPVAKFRNITSDSNTLVVFKSGVLHGEFDLDASPDVKDLDVLRLAVALEVVPDGFGIVVVPEVFSM